MATYRCACPTSNVRCNAPIQLSNLASSSFVFKHQCMFRSPASLRRTQLKHRHVVHVNPFDVAWGTSVSINAQSLAANLFASSIFPYAAFLYYLTRSKKTPGLALFGFYFLLVFVFATIPAGIYAKTHYGTILANVDWLHGGAESLLTITNLMIVLGVREGIRQAEKRRGDLESPETASNEQSKVKEKQRL